MGFFDGVLSFAGDVCSAVKEGIHDACRAIGGAVSGAIDFASNALATALDATISTVKGGIEFINNINNAAKIIGEIAERIDLKEVGKDSPDELGAKAKQSDKKPEDFDSTEDYIKGIQVERLDGTHALENMSDEAKLGCRVVGIYLYAKGIDEKLGIDNSGLSNSELTGVALILPELVKLSNVLPPDDFIIYSKYLQSNGLSTNDFANYLHGTSQGITVDKKVQDAMVGAMKEINPYITENDINKKLFAISVNENKD